MPAQPDSSSPAGAPGLPAASVGRSSAWYRWLLLAVGILLLLGSAWLSPARDFQLWPAGGLHWLVALLLFPFMIIAGAIPISVLAESTSLAPLLSLACSALSLVALGVTSPTAASLAGSIAIFLGALVYAITRLRPGSKRFGQPGFGFSGLALQIGALNTALALSFFAVTPFLGATSLTGVAQVWTFMLVFALIHGLLLLADATLRRPLLADKSAGRELAGLAGIELLPLPFIGMLVGGYPPALAAALLGLLACLVAVLLNRLQYNRGALERRGQELAALSQVSQALRSTDSLEELLAGIHQQVSQALGVENFYVALFDGEREKIWYPLAVKGGQRVHWDARSLTDRLTDRVIRSREPILLPRLAGEELVRIGLPPSQDALSAWMGVPLTGSQGLIGCLAVFSFSPQTVFTRDELQWLTTLAGQASVAIESILQTSRSFEESQTRELFTAALVHDLRSPASAILGALDVIDESQGAAGDGDLQVQAVSVARHAAQRLINLIDSLMDIARAQSGNLELSLAPVDLRKLVLNVLADFYPQAKEYEIILRNETPDDLPQALADASKTQRVLANLVDNALKFSPAGGQVAVQVALHEPGMLAVAVGDSGPGIPEEYLEKIFDRFSQVPGLHGRRYGSGLGLTFCRLVVEAEGGRIWVEARPGGGSVFVFTLPLAGLSES